MNLTLDNPHIRAAHACIQEGLRRKVESPEAVQQKYKHDPFGFVMQEWPWGVVGGPLEHSKGPDAYQRQFLTDLGKHTAANNFDGHTPVPPVMMSVSSANGTGKSSIGAMIAWWILRTRPMSQGTATAGNYQQLEERTWADIMHWGRIARGGQYFDIQKSGIYHKDFREKWKVTPKTAKAENAQAFAGQHARTSTSWLLYDEASEIPDPNWHAGYSCLTDGEPMMFAWGQMLKSYGEFYKITFGDGSARWDTRVWDGRESEFTNKQTIKDWENDWGEDSDYYRVHVLGLAPRASALQFIGQELVDVARKREHRPLMDEPLIVGYDAANGGLARHAIVFRRGLDAKSIPPIMLPGDTPRDVVVSKLAEIMNDRTPNKKVTALFGDQAFGAVILERLRNSGYTNCFEVNFGDTSFDKHFLNMRSQMWGSMKEWLALGAIPDDEKLAQQFFGPGFHDRNGKLVLESKQDMAKRKVRSPDYPDGLCFVAGTKVRTKRGERAIELLSIGDIVETPFGCSPVEAIWISETEELTEAKFSNGASLKGKPGHEIFTFSAGKKRLDALSLTDEVEIYSRWRKTLWRIVSSCFIVARSFGFKQVVDTFNLGGRMHRRDFCTAAFTQMYTGLYRKVSRFTTRMRSGAIAILKTLSLSQLVPIEVSTCESDFPILWSWQRPELIWIGRDILRQNGTALQKAESRTASTPKSRGQSAPLPHSNARDAALTSRPFGLLVQETNNQNTAQEPVSKLSSSEHISRTRERVLSAEKRLWLTVTGRRPVVPVSVQTENVPPTLTYNLTLREHNAYYANGVLVFNCLTFARPVAIPKPVLPSKALEPSRVRSGSLGWMG